jgi:hypothetical protein
VQKDGPDSDAIGSAAVALLAQDQKFQTTLTFEELWLFIKPGSSLYLLLSPLAAASVLAVPATEAIGELHGTVTVWTQRQSLWPRAAALYPGAPKPEDDGNQNSSDCSTYSGVTILSGFQNVLALFQVHHYPSTPIDRS